MTTIPPAIHPRGTAPVDPQVEATRLSLETRVTLAVQTSTSHGVLVRRAVDELRSALEMETQQQAYLPPDITHRLLEVHQMRACLVEGLVRNSLAWERSVCCTSRAVRYLDRFLGGNGFDIAQHEGWVYHLVSNACQSITVKLTETQAVDPDALQQHLDIRFDKTCVNKMESVLLKELGWSINDIVPATYSSRLFYALGFEGDLHQKLTQKFDLFALSILYDPNLCFKFPPSVMSGSIVTITLCDEFENVNINGVLLRIQEVFARVSMGSSDRDTDALGHSGALGFENALESPLGSGHSDGGFDVQSASQCVTSLDAFRNALANSARR